jgi:epsilon-lactone hydrolase
MPSKQFLAYRKEMAAKRESPTWQDLRGWRARIDDAMGQLPLAEGTAAVAVSAKGVEAFLQQGETESDDPLVVYFHGGGYGVASALAYRAYCSHLVKRAGVRVLNVDYRLAPEHPFPAAIEDAVSAYEWVLSQGTPASRVVLAGDSAGAGLTAGALVVMRDRGVPLPAGGVCLSPWVDLTNSAATYRTRADTDTGFSLASAKEAAALYLQRHDPRDALASPVFADLSGLPPLLILVGGAEVLLDDARRLADAAAASGVSAELFVYPDMPHVWMLHYPAYPEAATAFDQIAAFVARVTRQRPPSRRRTAARRSGRGSRRGDVGVSGPGIQRP